jgi:acyl carrier protein
VEVGTISEPLGREALLAELRRLVLSGAPSIAADLPDNAPLITSGLLESAALLNVALWVEDRLGVALELGDLDLAAEWDSMSAIVGFVERHRARQTLPGTLSP